jgi:hypothetical protein
MKKVEKIPKSPVSVIEIPQKEDVQSGRFYLFQTGYLRPRPPISEFVYGTSPIEFPP